jgi:hypothetical protein
MKESEHMACTGDRIGAYRVLIGRPEGNFENLGVDGMTLLK